VLKEDERRSSLRAEALGPDQSAMLERGEVHVGIRHDQYPSRHLASHALPPDEVLAACFVTDINLIPRPGRRRLLGRWLRKRPAQEKKTNAA
jgi:hypothetical protein